MPQSFAIATPEEAAARAVKSTGADVDLSTYRATIDQLSGLMSGAHSQWGKVQLLPGEKPRTERKRFAAAAAIVGRHVQMDQDKGSDILWIRIRPAPKARAPRAPKNGAVSTVPASAEVVAAGKGK